MYAQSETERKYNAFYVRQLGYVSRYVICVVRNNLVSSYALGALVSNQSNL